MGLSKESFMQPNEWLFIGIFFIVALILPTVPIVLAQLLNPKRPSKMKQETYECGIETVGDAGCSSRCSTICMRWSS